MGLFKKLGRRLQGEFRSQRRRQRRKARENTIKKLELSASSQGPSAQAGALQDKIENNQRGGVMKAAGGGKTIMLFGKELPAIPVYLVGAVLAFFGAKKFGLLGKKRRR